MLWASVPQSQLADLKSGNMSINDLKDDAASVELAKQIGANRSGLGSTCRHVVTPNRVVQHREESFEHRDAGLHAGVKTIAKHMPHVFFKIRYPFNRLICAVGC